MEIRVRAEMRLMAVWSWGEGGGGDIEDGGERGVRAEWESSWEGRDGGGEEEDTAS